MSYMFEIIIPGFVLTGCESDGIYIFILFWRLLTWNIYLYLSTIYNKILYALNSLFHHAIKHGIDLDELCRFAISSYVKRKWTPKFIAKM